MPMRRAASITSVPGGTMTSRSSIFIVMSFESAILYRDPQRTVASTSAGLKGHLPERCCSNSCAHFFTILMVGRAAASPSEEPRKHLAQPARPLSAGDAPTAGFVGVEVHDASRQIDHAGVLVDHDKAARPKHGTGLGHRVLFHRYVNFARGQERTRATARNHCL